MRTCGGTPEEPISHRTLLNTECTVEETVGRMAHFALSRPSKLGLQLDQAADAVYRATG